MNKNTLSVNDIEKGGMYLLEIYNKQDKGCIEVWLTNEEQKIYDRKELTERLLSDVQNKKCKVVFFMSGNDHLSTKKMPPFTLE